MAGEPTLYRDDHDVEGWVAYLQGLLDYGGFEPGPADGIFGPRTEAAVTAFQNRFGLMADGVCGNQTWALLNSEPDPGPGVNRPRPHRGGGGGGGRGGGGGGTLAGVIMRFDIDPDYDAAETRVWYVAKNTGTATAPAGAIQDRVDVYDPNGSEVLGNNFWNEAEVPPGGTYTHSTIPITPELSGTYKVHIGLDQGKGETFNLTFQHVAVWMVFADGPSYDPSTRQIVYTARNDGHSTASAGTVTDQIRVLDMNGDEALGHFPSVDVDVPPGGTYTQRSINTDGLGPGFYQVSVSLGGDMGDVGTTTFEIEGSPDVEEQEP